MSYYGHINVLCRVVSWSCSRSWHMEIRVFTLYWHIKYIKYVSSYLYVQNYYLKQLECIPIIPHTATSLSIIGVSSSFLSAALPFSRSFFGGISSLVNLKVFFVRNACSSGYIVMIAATFCEKKKQLLPINYFNICGWRIYCEYKRIIYYNYIPR